MENVVASIVQKRDLITLDLLGPNRSSKALDPPLQISSDDNDLPPLDLHRALVDDAPRPAVLPGSQSVCTIEKVKRALERETERQKGGGGSASTSASPSPSSSSSSVTTASIRRRADRGDEGLAADGGDGDSASAAAAAAAASSGSLVVAGCSGCLSYVLIPKGNPRCPRCDARLAAASVLAPQPPPPPPTKKKPRIDLNFSLRTL